MNSRLSCSICWWNPGHVDELVLACTPASRCSPGPTRSAARPPPVTTMMATATTRGGADPPVGAGADAGESHGGDGTGAVRAAPNRPRPPPFVSARRCSAPSGARSRTRTPSVGWSGVHRGHDRVEDGGVGLVGRLGAGPVQGEVGEAELRVAAGQVGERLDRLRATARRWRPACRGGRAVAGSRPICSHASSSAADCRRATSRQPASSSSAARSGSPKVTQVWAWRATTSSARGPPPATANGTRGCWTQPGQVAGVDRLVPPAVEPIGRRRGRAAGRGGRRTRRTGRCARPATTAAGRGPWRPSRCRRRRCPA